jgi:hypothetical protein
MVNNANGYVFNKDKGGDKAFLLTIKPEMYAIESAGNFLLLFIHNTRRLIS